MSEQKDLLPEEMEPQDLSTALKVVSLLFPIVGAILYFVHNKNEPKKAKSACTFALIGFGIGLVLNIIVRAGMG
jgi:uncharacterized membrane protein